MKFGYNGLKLSKYERHSSKVKDDLHLLYAQIFMYSFNQLHIPRILLISIFP